MTPLLNDLYFQVVKISVLGIMVVIDEIEYLGYFCDSKLPLPINNFAFSYRKYVFIISSFHKYTRQFCCRNRESPHHPSVDNMKARLDSSDFPRYQVSSYCICCMKRKDFIITTPKYKICNISYCFQFQPL